MKVEETPLYPIGYPLGRAWYVLSTFPKAEFNIENEIKPLGLDTYTPKALRWRTIAKRKTKYEAPLFTGYIFVGFDIDRDQWEPILDIHGVISVLDCPCGGDQRIPIRVNTELIERFKRAEMAGLFDYTRPVAAFENGQAVEIKEGPLAGIMAKIKSATAKKRVQIILEIFGAPVSTSIDSCFLQKIG